MMNKIKLAMFSDSFFPVWGGRERVIHECMKNHVKRIDAKMYCPKIKGYIKGLSDKELPYKVVRCKSIKVGKIEYLAIANKKFRRDVEEFKPDIIHCQTKYGLMNYALKYKKKYSIPVVTTIHTIYPQVYQNLKFKPLINFAIKRVIKILNKCDGIIAVSYLAKEIMEKQGVKVPIHVIKNGIEIKHYNFNEQTKKDIRNKYNIKNDNFLIMYAGWLEQRKNLMFQLKCLKELLKKRDDITMLFAGEGSLKQEMEKYVEDNGLKQNVIFTGYVSSEEELYSLYYTSDLFFFSSLIDSDGLVVVEAAINKTPSLILEGMAACERITNNYNGFIIKNDIEKCADKILEIISDKKLLENISKNAFNTLPKDWDEVSKEYEDFYGKVLRRKNGK